MSTAEEDRQLRRVIQKTLKEQKEERAGRRRQATLRSARLREIGPDSQGETNGGNAAKALYVDFNVDRTIGDTWAGKIVRHKLKSIEYTVVDDEGATDPPDGMQSFAVGDMGKVGRYPNRITLAKARVAETIDEDEPA